MAQIDGNWLWLLEGFKFELEAQVRPKTVEYYYDHARILVRWVETTGITEPRLLTKRQINSFFHYITNDSPTARRNNSAGEEAHHAESLRFHYYRGIKRFCLWLREEDYMEHNPLDGIVFRPPKSPPIEPYKQEFGNCRPWPTIEVRLPKASSRKVLHVRQRLTLVILEAV